MKHYLVIHHSATLDNDALSWAAIRRYHVETNGWRDIGYHFGFELFAGEPVGLIGRPLLARAAAEPRGSANRLGVHCCFVGNYDQHEPAPELLRFAAPILADICESLVIDIARDQSIRSHASFRKHVDGKTCPGKKFPMDGLRSLIRGA